MIDETLFAENLEYLERHGFLLIKNALDDETVNLWQGILYSLYEKEKDQLENLGQLSSSGLRRNSVGNVACDNLLALEPEKTRDLIAPQSVAPYLKSVLGNQCQLRSIRAHLNPLNYLQEWHMDFHDYWYQQERSEAAHPIVGLCMNTTFYLTNNSPEQGRLRFLRDFFAMSIPDDMRHHVVYTDDRTDPFQVWCDGQVHVDLHPMAGDAVVFYSHIPHQGAKIGEDTPGKTRANIVLHYQQNPMFPGIRFVSNPQFTLDQLGYADTFPFS